MCICLYTYIHAYISDVCTELCELGRALSHASRVMRGPCWRRVRIRIPDRVPSAKRVDTWLKITILSLLQELGTPDLIDTIVIETFSGHMELDPVA